MSMNLHVKFDGEEQILCQTPTQITYMCMVQPDGTCPFYLKGKKAIHALQIYIQWSAYKFNGSWNGSQIDLEILIACTHKHIDFLKEFLKTSKKIEVYIT